MVALGGLEVRLQKPNRMRKDRKSWHTRLTSKALEFNFKGYEYYGGK